MKRPMIRPPNRRMSGRQWLCVSWFLAAIALGVGIDAPPPASPVTPRSAEATDVNGRSREALDDLRAAVLEFMLTESDQKAADLAKDIRAQVDGKTQPLLTILPDLVKRPPHEPGPARIIDRAGRFTVSYVHPSACPDEGCSLLITVDKGIGSPGEIIERLGTIPADMVVASVGEGVSSAIRKDADSTYLAEAIALLSRGVSLNRNRAHLLVGGQPGWESLFERPDLLAGALALSAAPRSHYPAVGLPLRMQNLAGLRVFAIWRESDPPGARLVCRHLAELMESAGVTFTGIELGNDVEPDDHGAMQVALEGLSNARRGPVLTSFVHRFATASGGAGRWVGTAETRDLPGTAEVLSIHPGGNVDRKRFIRETLLGRMAIIEVRAIEGEVTVRSWRCARLRFGFPPGVAADGADTKITVNGKLRLEEPIEPDVTVLLNHLRKTMDPTRPVVAERAIYVREDPP